MNTFIKSTVILSICMMTINLSQGQVLSIKRLDNSTIPKDDLTRKITQLTKNGNVHGLSITVFENNNTSYQQNFGFSDAAKKLPINPSANMYGASLSKSVFAVLVMKLIEEKIIELDVPLESYLPKKIYEYTPQKKWHDNYESLKEDVRYHKITARMCLAHTSGLPNWRWFEADHKLRTLFEPGDIYSYSGEGLVYLQVVLEHITGRSLESLAQQKLFVPIGMKNSSYLYQEAFDKDIVYGHNASGELYEKDKDNDPRSASTLETSVSDLAIFMEAVLQKKILNPQSWAELQKTQVRIYSTYQFDPLKNLDSILYSGIKLGYGLGWGVLETPQGKAIFKEGHGDGFQHYCILFPDAKKGVMILSNSDNGEGIFKELLELTIGDIYTPWKWEGYIPYDQR